MEPYFEDYWRDLGRYDDPVSKYPDLEKAFRNIAKLSHFQRNSNPAKGFDFFWKDFLQYCNDVINNQDKIASFKYVAKRAWFYFDYKLRTNHMNMYKWGCANEILQST